MERALFCTRYLWVCINMPVCTVCAHPAEYLYTTYKTKSNIRLGVCVSGLNNVLADV